MHLSQNVLIVAYLKIYVRAPQQGYASKHHLECTTQLKYLNGASQNLYGMHLSKNILIVIPHPRMELPENSIWGTLQ